MESELMSEQWEKWEPVTELASKYFIDSISDDVNCFRIILCESKNEKKKVEVVFEDSVYAYRSTYESFRNKTINTLEEQYGASFYTDWTFFKVNRSKYIHWLSEQSYGISSAQSLIHFCLLAVDSIVDVISTTEPIFRHFNGKE